MRKHISALLTVILTVTAIMTGGTSVLASSIGIAVDGKAVEFTEQSGEPFIDELERTQVPLRVTMEEFGAEVKWNDASKTAQVIKDSTTVKVPIGKSYIIKNGEKIPNDTSARIKDGRTYLPIRAVLEAFGAEVGWNGTTKTVIVKTGSGDREILKVYFIDVGQGDAALIDYKDYEILIDAGNNQYGSTVVNAIRPYVDGDLELMIATHPDADHIGGLDNVLYSYKVDRIIDSGSSSDTATYRDYINAASSEGCDFTEDESMTLDIGDGVKLKIIETGDSWDNSNGNSVVCELIYDNVKVLFTGDMNETVEKYNLYQFEDVDVLKVAHHGSATSTCTQFLNVVKPEYAVISAGKNNTYGHPTASALARLFAAGTKVLGTFKSGTITLSTDGQTYSFSTSDYLTAEDAGAGGSASTGSSSSTGGSLSAGSSSSTAVATASYIGNKNSKIFHYSTCKSVSKMKDSNKVALSSPAAAIESGYRACQICRP